MACFTTCFRAFERLLVTLCGTPLVILVHLAGHEKDGVGVSSVEPQANFSRSTLTSAKLPLATALWVKVESNLDFHGDLYTKTLTQSLVPTLGVDVSRMSMELAGNLSLLCVSLE